MTAAASAPRRERQQLQVVELHPLERVDTVVDADPRYCTADPAELFLVGSASSPSSSLAQPRPQPTSLAQPLPPLQPPPLAQSPPQLPPLAQPRSQLPPLAQSPPLTAEPCPQRPP
ncbi:uncharacterized protein LOC127779366 [Oryza glaberrima]|uniref:uncharacterized protein LOC127779366 n=1 Tax=Oryza glaberrima TaxID=4538 RepID=UPI00224C11B8|nr:uncharacterized protein LOC127779366 [Oryza glaberrima]